jgi:hypothetical protein
MVAMLEGKRPEICVFTSAALPQTERLYGTDYSVPRLFETDLIRYKSPSDQEPRMGSCRRPLLSRYVVRFKSGIALPHAVVTYHMLPSTSAQS